MARTPNRLPGWIWSSGATDHASADEVADHRATIGQHHHQGARGVSADHLDGSSHAMLGEVERVLDANVGGEGRAVGVDGRLEEHTAPVQSHTETLPALVSWTSWALP